MATLVVVLEKVQQASYWAEEKKNYVRIVKNGELSVVVIRLMGRRHPSGNR